MKFNGPVCCEESKKKLDEKTEVEKILLNFGYAMKVGVWWSFRKYVVFRVESASIKKNRKFCE
jgi:hypothetical protein